MASQAQRATNRRTVKAAQLSLAVSTQIGQEWRTFCNMSLWGRLRWVFTGQITANQAALERAAQAELTKETE